MPLIGKKMALFKNDLKTIDYRHRLAEKRVPC